MEAKAKISRQAAWQKKKVEQGLCRICAEPVVSSGYCKKHLEMSRTRQRQRYRKKHGIPFDAPVRRGRPRK